MGVDSPAPAPQSTSANPILNDMGIHSQQASASDNSLVSTYPVDQEIGTLVNAVPRNLLEGGGRALDSIANLTTLPRAAETAGQLIGGKKPDAHEHPMFQAIAKEVADRLGLPSAENTPLQQDTSAAIRGAVGGAPFGVEGAVANGVSELASRSVQAGGGGPALQAGVGTLAGAAASPSTLAGGIRGLVRGGDEAAANIRQNQEMFEKAGANPDLAQLKATRNPVSNKYEAGGGDRVAGTPKEIKVNAANQPVDIQGTVENTAVRAAPTVPTKDSLTPTTGGEGLEAGFKAHRQLMAANEKAAYDRVSGLVNSTGPNGETISAHMDAPNFMETMKAVSQPTGIPEVDKFLVSGRTQKLSKGIGFTADVNAPTPQGPDFTFDSLRQMRSSVGNAIDWGLSPANPQKNGELKRLYGALGKDLSQGVAGISPEAQSAYTSANNLYKANQVTRDRIDPLIDKGRLGGGEAVYKAATSSTKDGSSRLNTFLTASSPDQQGILKGVVINRLGHPGGALDRPWDENTYLNNWQAMDRGAKDSLFGKAGTPMRDQLNAVEGVLQLRRDLGYSRSNLAADVAQGVEQGTHKIGGILHTGATVLGTLGIDKLIEHLSAGHALGAIAAGGAAAVAGTISLTGNKVMARVMTNPKSLKWLAQASKSPKAMAPVLLNQLNRMGSDGDDLKKVIQGQDDNGGT